MAKSPGKCVFCKKQRTLTHGHVWPQWITDVMDFEETQHVILTGQIERYKPTMRVSGFRRQLRHGHGTSRKPRNTCIVCNSGWMSTIENIAKRPMTMLMCGEPLLLTTINQLHIASLLCLIAMRNEFNYLGVRAISDAERDWLRMKLTPPWNWQIWLSRYVGRSQRECWYWQFPMHVSSSPPSETGPHKCNTQTTTLAIGQLGAHLFSSTDFPEFGGYEGIHLCKIWPPAQWHVDWRRVPAYNELVLRHLADALSRGIPAGEI